MSGLIEMTVIQAYFAPLISSTSMIKSSDVPGISPSDCLKSILAVPDIPSDSETITYPQPVIAERIYAVRTPAVPSSAQKKPAY